MWLPIPKTESSCCAHYEMHRFEFPQTLFFGNFSSEKIIIYSAVFANVNLFQRKNVHIIKFFAQKTCLPLQSMLLKPNSNTVMTKTQVLKAMMKMMWIQNKKPLKHPGQILDKSWINPGQILDRSWIILDILVKIQDSPGSSWTYPGQSWTNSL